MLKLDHEKRIMIALTLTSELAPSVELQLADLVKMTRIKKSTLQGVLERLMARGLIRSERRLPSNVMHFMTEKEARNYYVPLQKKLDHPYALPKEIVEEYKKKELMIERVDESMATRDVDLIGTETYEEALAKRLESGRGKMKKKPMRFRHQRKALNEAIRQSATERVIYKVTAFPFAFGDYIVPKGKIRYWTRAKNELEAILKMQRRKTSSS